MRKHRGKSIRFFYCFLLIIMVYNCSGNTIALARNSLNAEDTSDQDQEEEWGTPVWGHSYKVESIVAATCTSNGYTRYVCVNCGISYKTVIAATGHSYDKKVVEPTCEERGYTIYTCKDCGYTYSDQYLEALGHKYGDWIIGRAPTASTEGYRYKVCEHEQSHIIGEYIPCLNKDMDDKEADTEDQTKGDTEEEKGKDETEEATEGEQDKDTLPKATEAETVEKAIIKEAAKTEGKKTIVVKKGETVTEPEAGDVLGESDQPAENELEESPIEAEPVQPSSGEQGEQDIDKQKAVVEQEAALISSTLEEPREPINALDVILTIMISISGVGFCVSVGGDLHVIRWDMKQRMKHMKKRITFLNGK